MNAGPRGRGRRPSQGGEQLTLDLDALLADTLDAGTDPHADVAAARPPGDPSGRGLSAIEIADLLGRPWPTSEQVAVIEAPVSPLLVVAGAGSGKTETMAARVVWLVANGYVAPDQVLGLTFTRKAAGELADRIRARLGALHRRGVTAHGPDQAPVTVSTYHAYAATILGDHGLRLGLEPSSRLLGEAGAWQLVAELVERWDGDMTDVAAARSSVVEYVLALAAECAEHLVGTADVDAALAAVAERVARLPAEIGGVPGPPRPAVRDVLSRLRTKQRLLPLMEAYLRRKRELEVLDFGDQVALAARVAREVPDVGLGERRRFGVVLLDEYQDTSHAQLTLLKHLFGDGHPVTAVGDPHQSIYGWRGASAGNLQRFGQDFPPAAVAHLTTSWRNDRAVLAAANRVADPLRRPAPWLAAAGGAGGSGGADVAGHVPVPPLVARPEASAGGVEVQWHATVEEEAAAVADFADRAWRARSRVAVLCRTRSQFPLVEAALRARGLPVEVVGLGGLLHVPEVADLRAALEVVHDPTRGDSLMRLLTGAAWQLGPADLDALGAWAARLVRRVITTARELEPDPVDDACLVEALDDLPPPQWAGPAGQQLSAAGRARLHRLAGLLRYLRGRTALPLPDLVLEVERALLLDVEVAARPGVRPAAARTHLDAFADVAAGYADNADRPTLGGFLGWLAAAETEERGLDAGVGEPREDCVQVLTVHAAKGLEWDAVAVTGLVEGTFPSGHAGRAPTASGGWLTAIGALPFPVRGDVAGLPRWDVAGAGDQDGVAAALEAFRADCAAHEVAEERRLAYVALTRARQELLLTGAVWGDGSSPRAPSRFLVEVAELCGPAGGPVTRGCWTPPPPDRAANPRENLTRSVSWPLDPAGQRRPGLESGAALVLAALSDDPARPGPPFENRPDPWAREVQVLLAERAAGAATRNQVVLPAHLSASAVVALATDPLAFADRLRRPMPEPPSPQSRRGSAFHAWLEQRFGAAALVDVDELPGAADDDAADAELARLQQRFLASEWADRIPEQVEVTVETPIGSGPDAVSVRGRIDAVFRVEDGAGAVTPRWLVVDWKTGPPATTPEQARARAVQLAVYRLAWSRLVGVPVQQVSAAFFYATTGRTERPVDLLDGAGLAQLIEAAVTPTPAPAQRTTSTTTAR